MTLGLTIFIIVAILLLAALIALFLPTFIRKYYLKYHREIVSKKLYQYAQENDCILLNDVCLYLYGDVDEPTRMDHVLFADKYIYVFLDFAKEGGIYGNPNDPYIFYESLKGNIESVENPIATNEMKIRRLAESLKIIEEDKILVSVIVYNESLIVPENLRKMDQGSFAISLNEMSKILSKAEKDDVDSMAHAHTQDLANKIYERSNQVKEQLKSRSEERRSA